MMAEATRRPRRRGRTRRILRGLQVLAGVTVVVAAFLAWRESRPFTLQLQSTEVQQQVFLGMERRPARFYELESRFARKARVDACVQAWLVEATVGTSADRLNACINVVRRNLTIAPAGSNDWLVAAILSNLGGDLPDTERYLKRSLATGPTEQWIAKRRGPLLFDLRDKIDDELKAQIDVQLGLMLRTEEGVNGIAEFYIRDPAFRERIVRVAETVEPIYQQRFLNYVYKWAAEINSPPAPQP